MTRGWIVQSVAITAAITAAVWMANGIQGRAQELCPPGQVCNPAPCFSFDAFQPLQVDSNDCTTEIAYFTPDMDTWTYIFGSNNAIKIGTQVPMTCPTGFALKVDRIRISQIEYATRRDPQFADTVCNPTFEDGVDCVFYRVHGETVDAACHDQVDYKVFWNTPTIQGNKHDWMLLRAPCEEFTGDNNPCVAQPFSQNITTMVDRKPPVGTDPVVGGNADGMSDYIVAISTAHPHKGIPSSPF